MTRTALTLALATSLAALAPAAAFAATDGDLQVRIGDLDLATPDGQAKLAQRIDRVANRACSSGIQTGSIVRDRADPACVARVKAEFERRVAQRADRDKLGG